MLSRWYTDLKTVAWSGKYNDLTDKPTIPNGAAASCAVANNDTTTAAGSVADARIVRQHGLEIDEINRDLTALNDAGAIQGMDAREDGVYITYTPVAGADAVTKKLGRTIGKADTRGDQNNNKFSSIDTHNKGANIGAITSLSYTGNLNAGNNNWVSLNYGISISCKDGVVSVSGMPGSQGTWYIGVISIEE